MIDISDSVFNAKVKFAIATAFFLRCFALHSFSLVVPIVLASIVGNLFDFCDFNRSANPATLANALSLVHHFCKFFLFPSRFGLVTFDSPVQLVSAVLILCFSCSILALVIFCFLLVCFSHCVLGVSS